LTNNQLELQHSVERTIISTTSHWNRHACIFQHCADIGFSNFTFTFESIDCIHSRKGTSSCDRERWPMTLTIKLT